MEKNIYTGKGIGVCILDTGIYEHIRFFWTDLGPFMIFLPIKCSLVRMDMAP